MGNIVKIKNIVNSIPKLQTSENMHAKNYVQQEKAEPINSQQKLYKREMKSMHLI